METKVMSGISIRKINIDIKYDNPKVIAAAKQLCKEISKLPLSQAEQDKLLDLIINYVNATEECAYLSGIQLGISFGGMPKQ